MTVVANGGDCFVPRMMLMGRFVPEAAHILSVKFVAVHDSADSKQSPVPMSIFIMLGSRSTDLSGFFAPKFMP